METQDKKQVSLVAMLNCCIRRRDVYRTAGAPGFSTISCGHLALDMCMYLWYSPNIYFTSCREN